jgi:hypothetical protein
MTSASWELAGQPGDIILLGVQRVNVFAESPQDITLSGLPLSDAGRAYIVHPIDQGVCVTIEGVAGDRVSTTPRPNQTLTEPAGWVQIQACGELSRLIDLIRFAPGEKPRFFHSAYDASGLIWRWFLRWRIQQPAPARKDE